MTILSFYLRVLPRPIHTTISDYDQIQEAVLFCVQEATLHTWVQYIFFLIRRAHFDIGGAIYPSFQGYSLLKGLKARPQQKAALKAILALFMMLLFCSAAVVWWWAKAALLSNQMRCYVLRCYLLGYVWMNTEHQQVRREKRPLRIRNVALRQKQSQIHWNSTLKVKSLSILIWRLIVWLCSRFMLQFIWAFFARIRILKTDTYLHGWL